MADKKITELSVVGAGTLSKNDVFPVVAVSGTPITKKVTAEVLFSSSFATGAPVTSNVAFVTSATVNALSLIKGTLSANVNTTGVVAGGEFVSTLGTSTGVGSAFGLIATAQVTNTASVTTELAAGKLTLDVGNAASVTTNTYGLSLQVANTATGRAARPRAFLALTESVSTNALSTLYMLEATNLSANTLRVATFANTTVAAKLSVRINGQDYWIMLSSNVS